MDLLSAIFIDFDNVYSTLFRYDQELATKFANHPLKWCDAIDTALELPAAMAGGARRSISVRCYASPWKINAFRTRFTQAGIEVVDCPPLTSQMKNGADIQIVMDIMNYLTRYPHIAEYVILSADADFTPVLTRLRREMKRTAIFTAPNTSSAYRNCTDCTIDVEFFIKHLERGRRPPVPAEETAGATPATGGGRSASPAAVRPAPAGPPAVDPPAVPTALAERIGAILADAVRRVGTVSFAAAGRLLADNLKAEMGTNWAGQKSLQKLLEAIAVPEAITFDWQARTLTGERDVRLDGWPAEDDARLHDFVSELTQAARRRVPLLPPATYATIFDQLGCCFRETQEEFGPTLAKVAAGCIAAGVEVASKDIRSIAAAITSQGYRFGSDAEAAKLAALWRLQLFEACDRPDWMRDEEDAALLVDWCHAVGEDLDVARESFLARTRDEPAARVDDEGAV